MTIVEKILEIEWNMFDQVHNIGGRARCQDEKDTFYIMRSSQLVSWNSPTQESYYEDLMDALKEGRNLLSEKYGYMMERTHPEEYDRIKDMLPEKTEDKKRVIMEICAQEVEWQEELKESYPSLVGRGRPISKEEDTEEWTSFETYLWGELATYSEKTLILYKKWIDRLKLSGRNLNQIILHNTVANYGYLTLEDAEQAQSRG